jgi:hypothetical protein
VTDVLWESQIRTRKVIKINNKKIEKSGCLTYILKKLNCYKAPLRDFFFFWKEKIFFISVSELAQNFLKDLNNLKALV